MQNVVHDISLNNLFNGCEFANQKPPEVAKKWTIFMGFPLSFILKRFLNIYIGTVRRCSLSFLLLMFVVMFFVSFYSSCQLIVANI